MVFVIVIISVGFCPSDVEEPEATEVAGLTGAA